MIKKAKPITLQKFMVVNGERVEYPDDEVYYPEHIIAERESVAAELERIADDCLCVCPELRTLAKELKP